MHTGLLLPPGGALAKKPRVYQLAAEFGVESKVIMVKLQQMGEFVRSASSTVEHLIAYKLRQDSGATATLAGTGRQPRGVSSTPPSAGLARQRRRNRVPDRPLATASTS
jgi:translation initiation factor IF-2